MSTSIRIKDSLYKTIKDEKGENSFSEFIESVMEKAKGICGSGSEQVKESEPKKVLDCGAKKKHHHKPKQSEDDSILSFFGF
ncbi:Uncharacterised protein [uncultured archaeon]|nr:Uncharacterised protein [uncultured archaeon]